MKVHLNEDFKSTRAVIKVIGVGGAGGNAVNRMAEAGLRDLEFIAANSDAQDLRRSLAPVRIQLGEELTGGLGVGGDPEKGRMAAAESLDRLREVIEGADLVFITAGMGGGTGTGAGPVVARLAREMEILTVGVVTRPFEFEGLSRSSIAADGIAEMRRHVDTLLVIPNQRLLDVVGPETTSDLAFRCADDVLRKAVQAISDVITTSGMINMDLNDIKAVMKDAGEALIGMGEESGDGRASKSARAAIQSPLLESVSVDGARGLIVNITAHKSSLKLSEIETIMAFITQTASPDARIKFGTAYDDSLGGALRVTVIATGFPPKKHAPGRLAARRGLSALSEARPPGLGTPSEPGPGETEDFARGRGPEVEWLRPAFLRIKARRLTK